MRSPATAALPAALLSTLLLATPLLSACAAEAPPAAAPPSEAAPSSGSAPPSDAPPSDAAPSSGVAPPSGAGAPSDGASPAAAAVPAAHRDLVGRFVDAINRGAAAEVGATFAPDARFDSVGRIYDGREEIMDRFLVPEVIDAGGRYTLLTLTPGERGRVIAEYDFATGTGGREHFTYDCAVSASEPTSAFTDCVGRYVG
ncbi:hypothetical protein Misp01_32340 [Microtetraspora sp. NBRC 13810]|uniref:nuclear transport factor 2 family protein n=1 Tax=Microtetraspora sp. NBRC 13810 TaxID=3030990 RepID=UPI0024A473BC|nr:nuclear transport factor 2 family protein [Microtetraspora sp. NBRC 13810]GLW08104.1 hypothetical protein Misp01_32340 [Microtetraspora sp. NBRC 13810]